MANYRGSAMANHRGSAMSNRRGSARANYRNSGSDEASPPGMRGVKSFMIEKTKTMAKAVSMAAVSKGESVFHHTRTRGRGPRVPLRNSAVVFQAVGAAAQTDQQAEPEDLTALEKKMEIFDVLEAEKMITWDETMLPPQVYADSAVHAEPLRNQPNVYWDSSIWRSPFFYRQTRSLPFMIASGFIILSNTVTLAMEADEMVLDCVDADHGESDRVKSYQNIVRSLNRVCVTCLVIETFIRAIASPFSPIWHDAWLVFDTCCMLMGLADMFEWMRKPAERRVSCSASTPLILCFRLVRSLRSARLFRVLRFIRPIRLVANMFLYSLFHSGLLFILVVLINSFIAIVFTAAVCPILAETDVADDELGFRDFGSSMLTQCAIVLRGFHWGSFTRPLMLSNDSRERLAGFMVFFFGAFSAICIRNFVAGTYVGQLLREKLKDAAFIDRESPIAAYKCILSLEKGLKRLDTSNDGYIRQDQFCKALLAGEIMSVGHSCLSKFQSVKLLESVGADNVSRIHIEDVLLAATKLTRKPGALDTLCIGHQQQRIKSRLDCVRLAYENDVHLMTLFMNEIASRLVRLNSKMTEMHSAFDEVNTRRQKGWSHVGNDTQATDALAAEQVDLVVHGIENHPLKRQHAERVITDLERRFAFWTRLLALEEKLREIENRSSSEGAKTDAQMDRGTTNTLEEHLHRTDYLKFAMRPGDGSLAWREILLSEVVPWLQREVATACSHSEFPSNWQAPPIQEQAALDQNTTGKRMHASPYLAASLNSVGNTVTTQTSDDGCGSSGAGLGAFVGSDATP
eukprot:TRINITY_DN5812_c0_g3_i1.p1 TRINITY_DN5812_c0_g3~~TRINITY_DN5812_c0_g3_i1.p1  ORF type:complete len:823 (-),score=100.50 TRINITY_DN5812_c0_g3_i1:195-2594(-)